jgi:hypothetical protein
VTKLELEARKVVKVATIITVTKKTIEKVKMQPSHQQ